eukprot:scaffold6733_cov100-Isochrysis_galbana.AAC.4
MSSGLHDVVARGSEHLGHLVVILRLKHGRQSAVDGHLDEPLGARQLRLGWGVLPATEVTGVVHRAEEADGDAAALGGGQKGVDLRLGHVQVDLRGERDGQGGCERDGQGG